MIHEGQNSPRECLLAIRLVPRIGANLRSEIRSSYPAAIADCFGIDGRFISL